ncbi:uncharacterized protein LACBIDRAFT_334118 [Laccaria bicolor S238N-H82]|uniref:Predicted protein n=1 Tax=Laccaria bicolor (strain S238N-H82 / ATCC MYA-4686) TaxID=486041 RepID=B0DY52_LACBS|nr:uncharacterized protein LACBIDRAFT_334118 [Laccaria bicolor S238N-H82]EDR00460.1 predicted protein [Laccaria bicolor S238N-H82]|eukprot:XP_001888852.1 predicted protein [Laccaria bicolor S238N-H82]
MSVGFTSFDDIVCRAMKRRDRREHADARKEDGDLFFNQAPIPPLSLYVTSPMAEVQIPPPTIDGIFCVHYKEVMRYPIRANHRRKCSDCGFDGRMRSLASTQSIVRTLSAASIVNKDDAYQCKKHAPTTKKAGRKYYRHTGPSRSTSRCPTQDVIALRKGEKQDG